MKWARIDDIRMTFDPQDVTGFAGMSSSREGGVRCEIRMVCSSEAAKALQAMVGMTTGLEEIVGNIGLERPSTRDQLPHKQPTDVPAVISACEAQHQSGAKCVGLLVGHAGPHITVRGWQWKSVGPGQGPKQKQIDTFNPCRALHARSGERCGMVQNHEESHQSGASLIDWPWGKAERKACADCGSPTVVRVNPTSGQEFTGCSAWPKCKWSFKPFKAVAPPKVAVRQLDLGDDDKEA